MIDFDKELNTNKRKIDCLRCKTKLLYSGIYRFHEGKRYGMLGNLFELFVNKESFEIYVCPKCGKVEFFGSPLNPHQIIVSKKQSIVNKNINACFADSRNSYNFAM